MSSYEIVIVGSGIAGLSAALTAGQQARTLLITKDRLEEANTRYAQGGIAAAIGADDSAAAHLQDTLDAGAGLVDQAAAAVMTAEARAAIEDLVKLGVPFDRENGQIALGREAAHSAFRIVHAGGDATGAHVERTLAARLRESGIDLREQTLVTDIRATDGHVIGLEVLDCATGAAASIDCRAVILATGGAGRLYTYTTNPPVATGDGIALAYRAGAEVMDMEFIQFHPTALHLAGAPVFLISEAVRGEGAILRDSRGHAFMAGYDARAELAPRDIVARAIQTQMTRTESDSVFLDLSHLPPDRVRSRFPQIDAFCRSYGMDITLDQLPVAPAAHYTMGGVRTNAWGETNVAGLYACGEVACTGVHGANRLASNSLLEGIVFARRAADAATGNGQQATGVGARYAVPAPGQESGAWASPSPRPSPARERGRTPAPGARSPTPDTLSLPPCQPGETPPPTLEALQRLMWDCVGIVRDEEGLQRARRVLSAWSVASPPGPLSISDGEGEIAGLVGRQQVAASSSPVARCPLPAAPRAQHELSNLVLTGRLVVEAAWRRRESRGAHYRSDYPQPSSEWLRHQVFCKNGGM